MKGLIQFVNLREALFIQHTLYMYTVRTGIHFMLPFRSNNDISSAYHPRGQSSHDQPVHSEPDCVRQVLWGGVPAGTGRMSVLSV